MTEGTKNVTDAKLYSVRIQHDVKGMHGGRGIFADTKLPLGALILEERPLLYASSYEALLQKCRSETDADVVEVLETMYPQGRGLSRMESVIAHNWHNVDPPPLNGKWASNKHFVGLWPTASLINHNFNCPNVTRTFKEAEDGPEWVVQYRTIREIAEGEEILDNYLDPRSSYAQRVSVERDQHGISSRRDEFDAPSIMIEQIMKSFDEIKADYAADSEGAAFMNLLSMTEEISRYKDPCLAEIFMFLSDISLKEDCLTYSLKADAMALELLTAREPMSNWSVMVTSRMFLRCVADKEADEDMKSSLFKLVKKHADVVYGPRGLELVLPDHMIPHSEK